MGSDRRGRGTKGVGKYLLGHGTELEAEGTERKNQERMRGGRPLRERGPLSPEPAAGPKGAGEWVRRKHVHLGGKEEGPGGRPSNIDRGRTSRSTRPWTGRGNHL